MEQAKIGGKEPANQERDEVLKRLLKMKPKPRKVSDLVSRKLETPKRVTARTKD